MYPFYTIKLLIIFMALPLSVEAKSVSKAVKVLPLSEVVWQEGTRYKLNKAVSDGKIELSLSSQGPKWMGNIPKFCKSEKIECQLFPSAINKEKFNIYVLGPKPKIDRFIKFLKKNSLKSNF